MLELKNVSAGYGRASVIESLSMTVDKGETVAVLGPNGAGKSTLMSAITGTIRQRGGTIIFDGEDISRWPSHRVVQNGLVLVPEGRRVFAPMSVRDNLQLGGFRHKGSLKTRFDFVFDLFPRLRERADQMAGTLSGGEQQMLAVGRALMSEPRFLLLDEPFLGLAPLIVQEIRRAMEALQAQGLTIILVEQKLDLVFSIASRAYVLIKGNVALQATVPELSARDDLNTLYFDLAVAQPVG